MPDTPVPPNTIAAETGKLHAEFVRGILVSTATHKQPALIEAGRARLGRYISEASSDESVMAAAFAAFDETITKQAKD